MKFLRFKTRNSINHLFLFFLIVGMWEFLSYFNLHNPIFPSPKEIIDTLISELRNKQFLFHIIKSMLRVILGFSLAAIIGVLLGLFIGLFPSIFQILEGAINFLKSIPPIAWIPLAILWFGVGEASKIYIIAYSAFFPIVLNTISGVRSIEKTLLKMAKNIGLKGYNLFKEIILPASLPPIFTGLKIGIGTSWMALIAAEMIGATSGLGYMIEESRQLLFISRIILGMITIGFVGFLCDKGLQYIEIKIIPWSLRK